MSIGETDNGEFIKDGCGGPTVKNANAVSGPETGLIMCVLLHLFFEGESVTKLGTYPFV